MKKRIIYLIGTVIFLAVLTITVQFVGNGVDENNNLVVKNLEALAGGSYYCSNSCIDDLCGCCPDCATCSPIDDMSPTNPVSSCMHQQQ